MKVAFWSATRHSGVTSCALAAGYLGAQAMNMRITLLDNHYKDSMMRELILGTVGAEVRNYHNPRECSWQWYRPGYYAGCMNGHGDTSLELVEEHLWFRYDEISRCESIFESEFLKTLKKADSGEKICFVDTEGYSNSTTKLILDAADLVIIMLPNNMNMVDVFFEEYHSIIWKSLLVFNKCRSEDQLARRRICEKHKIPACKVVTMPYVERIAKMVSVGRFRRFLMENATMSHPKEGYSYLAAIGRILNVIAREYRQSIADKEDKEDKDNKNATKDRSEKKIRTEEYGWELI